METYLTEADEILCALARSGDARAEEVLLERYMRTVRMLARPHFLAGGDAEDLIQEGMLGLLQAIHNFSEDDGASFKTFASLCIRNRLYSCMKAADRLKHRPLNSYIPFDPLFIDGDTRAADFASLNGHIDPEELVIGRERYEELFAEIKGLLSDFEAKILGLYLEGLSSGEIAEVTGRSPKSVDNAVQRVRRKLARHLNSGDSG